MTHHHGAEAADQYSQEFWDERYRSTEQIWSGNPNRRLIEQATDLDPGTALDVGCGEGADAMWLAQRGWQVTGLDVSAVALARGAARAAEIGDEVARRISWLRADLLTWEPAPGRFDLVSAQFMHLPQAPLEALHRRLAAAVRPGGSLLIVGHHPSDLDTTMGRPNHGGLMFTAEQIAAGLDPDEWQIVLAAAPQREAVDPEGHTISIHDAVMHAVRRR
ncbi:MAG: methyltransferase domain-containing protein [Actinomycetota bacterium]|nr:methyltransferase domain-containing protein [Actinomycetota bacterium]